MLNRSRFSSIALLSLLGLSACYSDPAVVGSENPEEKGAHLDPAAPAPAALLYDAMGVYFKAIALGQDAVFVTRDHNLLRIPLDGSAAVTLASGLGGLNEEPTAIVADGDDVYFLSIEGLLHVPAAGGVPYDVVSPAGAIIYPSIAYDADHLYWTDYGQPGAVRRVAKAGGASEVLGQGDNFPSGLVVRGGTAYWTALADDAIRSSPVAGGGVTTFASTKGPRLAIAADDTFLYWLAEGEAPMPLMKQPLAGGAAESLGAAINDAGSWPTNLAVDATHVYFALPPFANPNYPSCGIGRKPVGGGATESVAYDTAKFGCATWLVAAGANLYFAGDRGVARIPKP